MDEASFLAALQDLDNLARAEHGKPLATIASEEPGKVISLALTHPSAISRDAAEIQARTQAGFLAYLASSAQKYICGDPDIRKKVDDTVQNAQGSGLHIDNFTPEKLVESGGVALASLLIAHVPALGFVGAPVIAGFVLLLYSIGTTAFCAWANQTSAGESH
jgi:hypothetical protein